MHSISLRETEERTKSLVVLALHGFPSSFRLLLNIFISYHDGFPTIRWRIGVTSYCARDTVLNGFVVLLHIS